MIPIIIPYYKAPDKLKKCLEAITFQSYNDVELFVRNNDDDNIFYTKAINEGLKKFSYDKNNFVLVLTQDAYLEKNCLERLLAQMIRNPRCGIASPVQKSQGRVTWGGSAAAWPGGVHTHVPDAREPFETYWANGACMLLRTEMIREIGLMDENMRFICSDSDYSFTARSRNWKVMVVPEAECEHELDGSGSWGKNPSLDSVKLDDMIYFTEKWLSADLYKRLAFEGNDITNTLVRSQINHWKGQKKRTINVIESRVPFVEPPHGSDLLSKTLGKGSER